MIELTREQDVFVLQLQGGENRFNGESIEAWNEALDEVEKAEGPKALVTTGTGKFYSNGLDLEYMQSEAAGGPQAYLSRVLAIMERRGGIMGANVVLVRILNLNATIIILSNNDQFNPDSFGDTFNLREALIIATNDLLSK